MTSTATVTIDEATFRIRSIDDGLRAQLDFVPEDATLFDVIDPRYGSAVETALLAAAGEFDGLTFEAACYGSSVFHWAASADSGVITLVATTTGSAVELLHQMPINLNRLGDITDDEPEVEEELLELFFMSVGGKLGRLVAAGSAPDSEEIRTSAHAIKGSSANIGATILRDIAGRLERYGAQADFAPCNVLVARLGAEFRRLQQFFDERWD